MGSQTLGELYSDLLRGVVLGLGLDLSDRQMEQLATHFALLVQWNRRVNLTALRHPEQIAIRHFEESLFLAKLLTSEMGLRVDTASGAQQNYSGLEAHLCRRQPLMVDVGSGAGFPGLPLKVARPSMVAALLEPNKKKGAFLKEVVRCCGIEGVEVRTERLQEAVRGGAAADNPGAPADLQTESLFRRATLVTMRAVADPSDLLDDLKKLLEPGGQLALFVGEKDASELAKALGYQWDKPVSIPHSKRRVILIGRAASSVLSGCFIGA